MATATTVRSLGNPSAKHWVKNGRKLMASMNTRIGFERYRRAVSRPSMISLPCKSYTAINEMDIESVICAKKVTETTKSSHAQIPRFTDKSIATLAGKRNAMYTASTIHMYSVHNTQSRSIGGMIGRPKTTDRPHQGYASKLSDDVDGGWSPPPSRP